MMQRLAFGKFPAKHHIAFRDADGVLQYEECLTRDGFEGAYTIAYHQHRPHEQLPIEGPFGWEKPVAVPMSLRKRHFKTPELPTATGSPLQTTTPLLFNPDLTVGMVRPTASDEVYRVNVDGDDLYFIFSGSGTLRTPLGDVRFETDDYVYVPKGLQHRFIVDDVDQDWLWMECRGGMHLLKQWLNDAGQLRMDAPYCHRDFRLPEFTGPQDEGIRQQVVKRDDAFYAFALRHTPLDVVGWDGAVYPWAFPILNFQPRAGLVHLPPTWHGTFGTRGALICSFVPRVVDFHEHAIPCPYPHSSVDVDEFLFYVRGNFTSRRGVGPGSVSLHPKGLPHGPHPGAYEGSIGHRKTNELAVMIDAIAPLQMTVQAAGIEDPGYMDSFIEE
ncbi:MAG: homogentisate 1,2-dioxygenase [Myxococcota bacterium]